MCYTGKCNYEDPMGDCQLRSINVKKGLPPNFYPDDAGCIKAGIEAEQQRNSCKHLLKIFDTKTLRMVCSHCGKDFDL